MSNEISPNQLTDQEQSAFSYHQWQEQFLRMLFYIASVFGLPVLIVAILGSTSNAFISAYIASYIILLAVTFVKLPYWQKSIVLLVIIYGLGFMGLIETGIWGDTRVFFLGFITMATLLFSASAGIIASIISSISIIIVGEMVLSGQFQL